MDKENLNFLIKNLENNAISNKVFISNKPVTPVVEKDTEKTVGFTPFS